MDGDRCYNLDVSSKSEAVPNHASLLGIPVLRGKVSSSRQGWEQGGLDAGRVCAKEHEGVSFVLEDEQWEGSPKLNWLFLLPPSLNS